jgi:uncharacterized membrane protein (DUF485 family)
VLHEPAAIDDVKDYAIAFKTKMGLIMFGIYSVIYASFVAINLLKPTYMAKIVFMGLNLAVVYGFGLIVSALIMALIYNHACSKKESELNR